MSVPGEQIVGITPQIAPLVAHGRANAAAGQLVTDAEGTHSIFSMGVQDSRLNAGRETVIPTVYDGKIVSREEAVQRAVDSGIDWPSADTIEEATEIGKAASEAMNQFDEQGRLTMAVPSEQVSAGVKEIQALQAAGFDGDQIVDWRAQKQAQLSDAGFSDAEINGYFGKPETDMQPISDLLWANLTNASVSSPVFETAAPPRSPELIEAQAEAGAAVRERLKAEGFEPIETVLDALEAGWEISSIGLAAAGKMPDTVAVGDEPMYQRIAMQTATLTGDLPAMAAGFILGGGAGVETGPGALVTATAGAFALPTAIRETLIDGYENGEFKDFADFWDRASGIFLETGKAWVTGAATGAVGPPARGAVPGVSSRFVGPLARGEVRAPLLAENGAEFAAQVATMTTVGSALEGHVPTMQDFVDTAIVIGGLKGVQVTTQRLTDIYRKTGVPPQKVLSDIKNVEPLIRDEILSDRVKIPERYQEPEKTDLGLPEQTQRQRVESALKRDDVKQTLEVMKDEAGWAQRGGRVIRKDGEVVGRTPWLPKADWWPDRPGGFNEQQTARIIDKGLAGEKLGAKQQEYFDYLVETAKERRDLADYTPTAEDFAAEGFEGRPPDVTEAALVARAMEINENAVEKLATRFEENDAGFIKAIREFLVENKAITARGKTSARAQRETIVAGKTDAIEGFRSAVDGNVARGQPPAFRRTTSDGIEGELNSFDVSAQHADTLQKFGVSTPTIIEITDAKRFVSAIQVAKETNEFGAQVTASSAAEYAKMRLFITKDNMAGFALDGTNMVSLFNHGKSPYEGISVELVMLGVAEGGRRLDNFDTFLPKIYERLGFVETERLPWDESKRVADWDEATFSPWNNGRPDYLFMEYKPSAQAGAPGEVLSRISVDERQQPGYRFSDFYRDVVDDLNPLYRAINEATGGEKLPTMQDPYKLARLNRGVNGKAEHFLEYSPFKFETYENVGKPLKAILEPVKDRLDDVRAYVVARRSLELSERGIETGIPDDVSRGTLRALEKEMEPVAEELYAYQDHVVDYLVDSGVLSKNAAAAMREANRNYVPFFRVMDTEGGAGVGQGLATKQPVKRIKGSERRIVDPLESIIKNTYLFINLAERNAIADALWRVAEKFPESELATLVRPKMTPTKVTQAEILRANPEVKDIVKNYDDVTVQDFSVFRPNSFIVEKDQIAVYREGKRHLIKVDEEVARVFQGLDVDSTNALVSLLSVPAKFLRAGAILSPEFVGRNPIRDQLSAFVFSKAGFKPFLDLAFGIHSMVKKDANFKDWMKSGGPNATLVSLDRRYLQKNVRELSGQMHLYDYVVNVVKSPVEALRVLSDLAERGTRVGEFVRTTKGKQGKEAIGAGGFASREITLDFQRIGAKTRAVNALIAFWNANVQGTDKLIRAFRDQPVLTTAKIAGGITLPSILLYLHNRNDPEFKDIPRWQKDLFWLVHVDDTWWRIPKPFELGIIFGTGAERLVEKILDDDGHAFDGFLAAMGRGSAPGLMPTAMAPVIEAWANRSLFLDRPIIPHDRENVLPEYQYKPYTTEVAKALGKIVGLFPVLGETKAASPAIIENYVQAWTGGLGMHALRAADLALRKAGALPDPVKPASTLADIPFIKGFVVRYPSAGSENIQRFYDSYDQQQSFINTIKVLIDDNQPEEALAIMDQAISEGELLRLGGVRQSLTNSMKFIRLVHKNPDMTSDEKRQIIDTTYYQMSKIAELGNQIIEDGKKAAKENSEINVIAVQ